MDIFTPQRQIAVSSHNVGVDHIFVLMRRATNV